ncbi:MAG: EF-hand domain-containing protein [Lysobacteraceae bacterium]
MKQRNDIRAHLMIALAAAFATPAFAQSADAAATQDQAAQTTPTTQDAASQNPPTQSATPQDQATAQTGAKGTKWSDLDADKDGNLSKTEAASLPSLSAVFDKADTNADGALSGDEYKAYVAMNGRASSTKPGKH